MARRAKDLIPENILSAAKRAGLNTPSWYVGRTTGHQHHKQKVTLEDLAGSDDPGPKPVVKVDEPDEER